MQTASHANELRNFTTIWWAGVIALIAAIGGSLGMSIEHLLGVRPPGCGVGAGCAQASAGPWGSIPSPFGSWPTAFLGVAYFSALLVEWLAEREKAALRLRWIVRAGAAVSVLLIGVMIVGRILCPYCLAVHGANLTFWTLVELAGRRAAGGNFRSLAAAGVTFALVSIALGIGHARQQSRTQAIAEREQAASIEEVAAQANNPAENESPSLYGPENPFTGRWRIGPEAAPIRIVVFSDYQCKDCKRVETEIRSILDRRDDVSFSAKHFPFCRPCISDLEVDMHPNACWAARAAEAAGILRGNEGFWAMHHWLFDRGGGFTNDELNAHLIDQGYDVGAFTRVMKSDEVLAPIQAEVAEAMALGLHYTPMIFINGVEMKGFTIPNAVTRTVDELAARNLPPATAAADRPPIAVQKYVDDWQDQPAVPMPAGASPHVLGPDSPRVTIVLWGDYQEPNTAAADELIRSIVAARDDVRYQFRHFPFDQSCNSHAPRTVHDNACLAVRAAEAAGRIGGDDAFWTMHRWLMDHQDHLSAASILRAAEDASIDSNALQAAMLDPQIDRAIADDSQAAIKLNIQSLPMIFINNRYVPRWDLKGERILDRIVERAAQ